MEDSADPWTDELGAFEVEVDDSAAVARAERIAAARQAGKGYQAKFDEPGWFNDPAEASRSKGAARPALYALHQAYFEARFEAVVDRGLELLGPGIKEENEVLDLVMRAALRCGKETDDAVLDLARRWREFPNLPSHSLISARVLAASSSLRPAPTSLDVPTPLTDADAPIPAREVLAAALAALRMHPSLPLPRAFLRSLLAAPHPTLAAAIKPSRAERPPAAPAPAPAAAPAPAPFDEPALEAELQRVDVGDAERDILRRVLGLGEGGAGAAEDDDDDEVERAAAGRDVRSL
ncbi:uncharacterized protein RHOBADRAFT_55130 [Rhodotorula graminis WP1]|uniref:Uncharacterized protein n=1 Tax=Rhodotorula graminis (strain WP1) TaxID=578459 RepID=A0A0P9EN53_RHOGW|nr:uncharacterized protein RHOBADRAFT_55130 [Rhodotorula graminis WP1]KPV73378.1 hypothetical protein RHOBADRAFT_55130 [Rhodotorula graminis WP1]